MNAGKGYEAGFAHSGGNVLGGLIDAIRQHYVNADFGGGGGGGNNPPPANNQNATNQNATIPDALSLSVPTMNPLALNLLYSQSIAPMMNQVQQNLQGANAMFAAQAQNNPMAKYMPPQFQALFNSETANQAQQNNNLNASMVQAAMNAPAVDAFMNQLNTGRAAAVSALEKQMYNELSGNTGNLGPSSGSTTGSTTSSSTPNTSNTSNLTADQIYQDALNRIQAAQQTGP